MKKTLFLSAILGAALGSSAFGGTITGGENNTYTIYGSFTAAELTSITGDATMTLGKDGESDTQTTFANGMDFSNLTQGSKLIIENTDTRAINTNPGISGANNITTGFDLCLGSNDSSKQVNLSAIGSVEMKDGSSIYYNGKGDTVNHLTLGENASATIKVEHMQKDKGQFTGTLLFAGDTTLANGSTLTMFSHWSSNIQISKLTGNGTLALKGASTWSSQDNAIYKIDSLNGFTGNLNISKIDSGKNALSATINVGDTDVTMGSLTIANNAAATIIGSKQTTLTVASLVASQSSTLTLAANTKVCLSSGASINLSDTPSLVLEQGSVLDLTNISISGNGNTSNTIYRLLTAAQGDGLLKINTATNHWSNMTDTSELNANVDIIGNGLEIDKGSFTINEGKTLTVHGELQYERYSTPGKLTVKGTLDTSDKTANAHIMLGHGERHEGNLLISGSGLVKTNSIQNKRAHQGNTLTLEEGGSLQVTGNNLIEGSNNAEDDITITITNGKLIADGNNWTLNHGVTIGNVEVQGAKTVTMDHNVTFNEGANVKVGSSDTVGHLNMSGTMSGNAAFEVNEGSTLVFSSDVEMTALTLNGGTITLGTVDEHNSTLTTTDLTVTKDSAINADLVVAGGMLIFADDTILTMGCDVTIGHDDMVTVVLTDTMVEQIAAGNRVVLFENVDSDKLGSSITFAGNLIAPAETYSLQYDAGNKTIYVAPEPATATLSLLALAALAARRKRH